MIKALEFLIDTFSSLYLIILLLRFWLPVLRANFQNPVAQGVLRYTSPAIVPIRRFIPAMGRLDTATVIVAFVIQFLALLAIIMIGRTQSGGGLPPMLPLAMVSVVKLASLSVTLFIVAVK